MIAFLWAEDADGIIGRNGRLPWHLPDDLHYFRELTEGQIVVMGRKTFEGLKRPLPDRTNIVLTHQVDYEAPDDVIVYHDAPAVIAYAETKPDQNLIIIGGANLFASFTGIPDVLYRTKLAGHFEGDTHMLPIDYSQYALTKSTAVTNPDPQLTHTFEVWTRK
ncbi:dihydrofolate reductase [Lacticaseibacillus brantae]|uniref:Dihydrofolate reductase n=1 Tax=Lacticaseibacillus brantae DSM 23927 TaxID=1423727 RepID=A0A0R2B906_9LACO|nr:dihydrofolate reductase [Lacticaseibacillus brantae]KRM72614.1 dihydrofolate reductase [Lacticaseibacillus brantae DSM 23927]